MVPYRVANLSRLKPAPEYRRDHTYYELPAALDLETSKTGSDPKKDFAFVYIWQLAVGDFVVYGRTLEELQEFIPVLQAELRLAYDFRLVVYIHFLKYDFHFLKNYLQIEREKFIARSSREPLRIRCNGCIEFRDSYAYTEQPLWMMGVEVGIQKIPDYDHNKIRTPETQLTDLELEYAEHDVLILTEYFQRESSFYGGISRIPLTATQRVTRIISSCLGRTAEAIKWRVYAQQLDPRDPRERTVLQMLHIAFFGGFNFCNRLWCGTTLRNAYGADIDTSYGSQLLLHRYPRKRFKPLPTMPEGIVPPSMIDDLIAGTGHYKDKALLITCRFTGLEAKVPELAFLPIYCKNYLTRSIERKKSMKSKHLVSCENVETVLTDVDFRLVCKWYRFKDLRIDSILASRYDPLPEYIVQAVVDMIAQKKATKSELRTVEQYRRVTEQEQAEYTRIKSMVSRIYGCFVQDPLRMEYAFDSTTGRIQAQGIAGLTEQEEEIGKKKRFRPVLYQWGVWCASWARAEILSVIEKLAAIGAPDPKQPDGIRWNRKVLYSDTDSVKWYGLGAEALEIIERYNAKKRAQLDRFCKRYGVSWAWLQGLGELELEQYTEFRAIGLKQYAQVKIGKKERYFEYHIAGLPRMDWREQEDGSYKNFGCTYFDKFGAPEDQIEHLSEDLIVPADESRLKKTVFIDDAREGDVEDYLGNTAHVSAKSCIMIEPREFKLHQSFIERLQEIDGDELRVAAARNFEGRI